LSPWRAVRYGGHDPGVCACGTCANAAGLTGYADNAAKLADQAVSIGEEIEHPFSQSIAFTWATLAACSARLRAGEGACRDVAADCRPAQPLPIWAGHGDLRRLPGACGRKRIRTQVDRRRTWQATAQRPRRPGSGARSRSSGARRWRWRACIRKSVAGTRRVNCCVAITRRLAKDSAHPTWWTECACCKP